MVTLLRPAPGRLFLLALRLAAGGYLLSHAVPGKWSAAWLSGSRVAAALAHGLGTTPYPWYRALLAAVAVPRPVLFAWLVAWGETLVGACLLAGLWVPVAAGVQLFANLNYALMKGWTAPAAGLDRVFILALFVLAAYDAGRIWGLDGRRGEGAPDVAAPPGAVSQPTPRWHRAPAPRHGRQGPTPGEGTASAPAPTPGHPPTPAG